MDETLPVKEAVEEYGVEEIFVGGQSEGLELRDKQNPEAWIWTDAPATNIR